MEIIPQFSKILKTRAKIESLVSDSSTSSSSPIVNNSIKFINDSILNLNKIELKKSNIFSNVYFKNINNN